MNSSNIADDTAQNTKKETDGSLFCYDEVMKNKQDIYDYLNSQSLMVLSTVSEHGQPQSALVGFGQSPDLQLIIGTNKRSRKVTNILNNNRVSAVISWGACTIQYQGTARLLDGDEKEHFCGLYFAKSPDAKQYSKDPNECYFIIEPTWIRYTDVSTYPWEVTEFNF